jgi:hypothetical protein
MNILNNPRTLLLICNIFYIFSVSAQVGIGTTTPEADLDVISNDKGILFPRVELSSYTDATTVEMPGGGSPEPGTFVYNVGASGLAPSGYYIWNGDNWMNIKGIKPGDLKYGVQTVDHNGWYLLNGRLTSSLPATAQLAADQLGFATNLPNAADSYLKGKKDDETRGSIVGSNTASLTAANIPSISGTGTTSSAGGHVHPNVDSGNNAQHGHTWQERGTTPWSYSVRGFLVFGSTRVSEEVSANRDTKYSGDHSHAFNTNSVDHSHSLSADLVGSANAFDTKPSSLAVNIFVYLGE